MEYDLVLDGPNCPGLDDEINTYLHFRRSEKVLPDGTIHYFLDIRGTTVNEDTGTTVNVHAARRYTDDPTTDTTRFSGLQVQISAPGLGVVHLNAGTMDTGLSDPFAVTRQNGRWDGLFAADLPPAVCEYLAG